MKLYNEKEKKMYVNNVAPPKNMLLTQWFFRKEKARERSHLTPMEECSELAGRVEPLAVLRGSIPHMSLDASCQSGHI